MTYDLFVKHLGVRIFAIYLLSVSLSACEEQAPSNSEIGGELSGAESTSGDQVMSGSIGGEANSGEGMSGGERSGGGQLSCQDLSGGEAQTAQRFIQQSCGTCHGAPPQFGAPYPLIDLEELVSTPQGLSRLDRAVARLLEGTMPPAGQPTPSTVDAQAFIDWATCGEGGRYATPLGGFQVDRPVYQGPTTAPADAVITEFKASHTSIPSDQVDDYQCFGFHGPQDPNLGDRPQERSILRFEPLIDESRIVHHIVLYETTQRVENGARVSCGVGLGAAIYAWAPGQPPLHFRSGGLVSHSDQHYVLEIHYNNSARLEGLTDASGVRLFHTSPLEPKIDMMTMGPEGFVLPARQRTEVKGDCVIQEELEVVAMMPHMHEIGVDLSAHILHAGSGEWDPLIQLRGWDFNAQLVYDGEGVTLSPGDRVRTTCLFENEGDRPRAYGAFTEDEMCYHFVYVTPPPSERRCDVPVEDPSGTYPVGACAPEGIESHQDLIMGRYFQGSPPPLAGGELAMGTYTLSQLEMWFPSFDLGIAVLDPERSQFEAGAALQLSEGNAFALDLQGQVRLISVEGAEFMRALNLSFSGTLAPVEGDVSRLNAMTACPDSSQVTFFYQVDATGSLTLYLPFSMPVSGVQVMRFSPQTR